MNGCDNIVAVFGAKRHNKYQETLTRDFYIYANCLICSNSLVINLCNFVILNFWIYVILNFWIFEFLSLKILE